MHAMNSVVVAIKAINLDQWLADLENVRRTMLLFSHPNIPNARYSFTVDHRLWVVMPFMFSGSLQQKVVTFDSVNWECHGLFVERE